MDLNRCAAIESAIETDIQKNRLKPGDRLPAERTLAARYQVSRNTVREAVKALKEKGVVETRKGSGSYVTACAGKALSKAIEQRTRRLKEIFEIRTMLEPCIVRLAAPRIDPPTLEQLNTLIQEQEQDIENGGNGAKQDQAFHRLLAKSAENQVLMTLYDTLSDLLAETRAEALQTPNRQKNSMDDHNRIIAALEADDATLAAAVMETHMENVARSLGL